MTENANYIVPLENKKDFVLDRRNIRVAISPYCNLDCVYCDGPKGRQQDKPGAMEDFRRKTLDKGTIHTEEYLKIIESLHRAGFDGMTLTGGEPTLNPDWDIIVNESKKIGMLRIGLTTNGVLLKQYIKKNGHMPEGLTLLTISLDTFDTERFKRVARRDKLTQVLSGLSIAKEVKPDLTIRANKVAMRSDMAFLNDYIESCETTGIINEINLLNLILKVQKDKDFFEQEFVSAPELVQFLISQNGCNFTLDNKFEYVTELKSGLRIIIKDTNLTMRNSQCDICPAYCQEGFFTVRVATDGSIMACPDYNGELPCIDGQLALRNSSLHAHITNLMQSFENLEQKHTLDEFFLRYNIELRSRAI